MLTADGCNSTVNGGAFGGLSASVAPAAELPCLAVTATGVDAVTATVESSTTTAVCPFAMVTVEGPVTSDGRALLSATPIPPAGAGCVRVTFSLTGLPPTTAAGYN